jgi:hypothetical protein
MKYTSLATVILLVVSSTPVLADYTPPNNGGPDCNPCLGSGTRFVDKPSKTEMHEIDCKHRGYDRRNCPSL